MTGGGSLTYTVVLRRKRIGRLASCINRAGPVARQLAIGGVARPQSATPSTHTPSVVRTQIHGQRYRIRIQLQIHSQWPSLMLSDAMLQLTIFPNAINNRSLSFSP